MVTSFICYRSRCIQNCTKCPVVLKLPSQINYSLEADVDNLKKVRYLGCHSPPPKATRLRILRTGKHQSRGHLRRCRTTRCTKPPGTNQEALHGLMGRMRLMHRCLHISQSGRGHRTSLSAELSSVRKIADCQRRGTCP